MGTRLSLDQFDRTVADIYEAALDPAHWDVAMGGIVNRNAPTGWEVAFLIWETIAPPSGRFVGAFGVNEFARAGYLTAFAGRQPWSIHAHGLPVGTLVHSDELLPREQFKACDLYQRFLSSWGLEAALIGIVDRAGPQRLGLVLPGGADDPGPLLYEAVRRYLPHIQRATRISRKLGEANLRAENAEAVLQRTPNVTLVLGADLGVQFANHRAESFLVQGHADAPGGRLRLRNPRAQAALQALADGSDPAPSAAFVLEADGLPPYRMLAMRIAAPIAETLCGPVEGGAVLLVGHAHAGGVPIETLDNYASWFNLTPTEARLAAMLAQGHSLEDYARNRAVTVNAGRFLLKSIFAKTGATRQAELVALLRDAPDGWIEQREAAD
ncbi:MAG TPA: helix-turn-helix transcriptional regulator [Novosphingobium sp.]|nr:helix-turn-helix transcriptional regulator [Novosphingobium sp.]